MREVQGSECDLLEVCCSHDSRLTETVIQHGGIAYRVGMENHMDLTTEVGAERARQFADAVKPRWMWISTPCGPNSPLQNLNQKTAEQIKKLKQKRRKAKAIIRHAITLAEEQVHRGGHVGWEWPRRNLAWHFPEVKRFLDQLAREGLRHQVHLDGCQVGVVSPDTHEPMLKPWRIETTCKHMGHALNRQCNHEHEHVECVGHDRPYHSALYPRKMCTIMSRVIMDQSRIKDRDECERTFAATDVREHVVDEKQLRSMKEAVRRLHVRAGHPSNKALYMMLKARGVRQDILDIAKEMHCDECMEIKLPTPHKTVSFHTCNVLWECLQADIAQFVHGDEVVHVLVMVDEASRFAAGYELFRHDRKTSRNATTEEVIRGFEQAWCQYHGYPGILRTDPEGCFRGLALGQWCASRGIELAPCVGEDHGQIGVVESLIGKLKNDAKALMRLETCDPYVGVLHVITAHNQMDRIGGFAPAQWAYGRLPTMDNRLFEGSHSLPFHSTEATMGTDLRANLNLRVKAEEQYRRTQALDKVNRALNSKPRPFQVFLPGDLVYYRRYKTPHSQQASHMTVDQAKLGLARWFGPARVLSTETRSTMDPDTRKPAQVVWIIAGGRLKRCSPHQLRHASEKEKILAEASEAITMPWSFNSLMSMVERGQFEKFDDLEEDESDPRSRLRELSDVRGKKRSQSLPQEQNKTPKGPQKEATAQPKTHAQRPSEVSGGARKVSGSRIRSRSGAHRPQHGPPSGDRDRARSHGSELENHPQFKAAQQRAPDRRAPQTPGVVHEEVLGPEKQTQPSSTWSKPASSSSPAMTLNDLLDAEKTFLIADGDPVTDMVYMSVPLPETNGDMKQFVKNSEKWVSKKMKKGVEIKWKDVPVDRLEDFKKAKTKELSNWIREKAVRLVSKDVPAHRIMKMRWIYTVKEDNSAKARIVIIGYQDPDLTNLNTTSPTMSRRSRSLFLTVCACKGWSILKGDVRGAFLQGLETETEREVFARPVVELAEELGGNKFSVVQIQKACYGLANAPAQWHASISQKMREAGFIQLATEPCGWKLVATNEDGEVELLGLAVAHVDDFLFGGCSNDPRWQRAVDFLYQAYKWSPWEIDAFSHCGVQVLQKPDGTTMLNHAEYCEGIELIQFDSKEEKREPTDSERSQLRGALGALQWRVYQTGPQHGARLSLLQSQLAHPTIQTLKDANKLIRETYAGRQIGLKYQKLNVEKLEDVTFVAWSDAAVGNRVNLDSSGGYVIGACDPSIVQGKPSHVNLVSWKSGKLPRIARSSLSAEIQAFSLAEEELMYIRLQWLEMIGHELPVKDPASIVHRSPGVMVTDARSLFDIIKKGPISTSGFGLKEKYSALDMMSVFQRLAKCQTETRWVHSEAQLADGLTKPVPNAVLLRVLVDGMWTLVDDPTFTSAKRRKRDQRETSSRVFGVCECHSVFVHEADFLLPAFLPWSHDTSFSL